MKRTTLLIAALGVIAAAGCGVRFNWSTPTRIGSGKLMTEQRTAADFDQIVLLGAMDIEAAVGEEPAITVEADDNLLEIITTEIQNKKLVVSTRENYSSKLSVKVKVRSPALRVVELNGSGTIRAEGVSGQSFDGTIRGSGDIVATGAVEKLRLTIAGSGNLNLGSLEAEDAAVTISGSGDATVRTVKTLDATINGSGSVAYRGEPRVTKTIHGSGSVRPASK